MSPDTWSQPEIVRSLQRIERGVTELRQELRSTRDEFVPREVWDQAWAGLTEWKTVVSTDVVNLQAEAARTRKDIDERFAQERRDRLIGIRWGIGIGISGAGLLFGIISQLGLGA